MSEHIYMNRCAQFSAFIFVCAFQLLVSAGRVLAETVSVEKAARLQATLNQFILQASTQDGSFTYLNRKTAKREQLYPAGKHPMIIPFFEDYYLCVTMLNKQGQTVNVDFLLRPKSDGAAGIYMVVDTFVDARHILEKALESR